MTDRHVYNLPRVAHEKSHLETQKFWLQFPCYLLLLSAEYSKSILFKQLEDREQTVFIDMFKRIVVKLVCVGLDSYCGL